MSELGIILIALAISIVVSVIFRFLDKSNQQLSKLKLFVDKSIKELDSFMVEKKQTVKDLTIDLDFHINQAKLINQKYEKQNSEISLFFSKFSEQKDEIEKLKKSIRTLNETKNSVQEEIANLEKMFSRVENYKKEIESLNTKFNQMNDSLISRQETVREQIESYLVELHEKANAVIQQNAKQQFEKLKEM